MSAARKPRGGLRNRQYLLYPDVLSGSHRRSVRHLSGWADVRSSDGLFWRTLATGLGPHWRLCLNCDRHVVAGYVPLARLLHVCWRSLPDCHAEKSPPPKQAGYSTFMAAEIARLHGSSGRPGCHPCRLRPCCYRSTDPRTGARVCPRLRPARPRTAVTRRASPAGSNVGARMLRCCRDACNAPVLGWVVQFGRRLPGSDESR